MNRKERRRQKSQNKGATLTQVSSSKVGVNSVLADYTLSGSSSTVVKPDLSSFLDEAIHYHQSGQLNKSLELCDQILTIQPDQPIALHLAGLIYLQLDEIEKAVHLLNSAVLADPNNADTLANFGAALVKSGEYENAENTFRQALKIHPKFTEVLFNLGSLLKRMGKIDEAADTLRQAVSTDPSDVDTLLMYAGILKMKNDLSGAIDAVQQVLAISPNLSKAHFSLGAILSDQKKLDEAKIAYQKAIDLDPSNVVAEHMLASISGETTNQAPQEYVRDLFDGVAPVFDHELVNVLDYRKPEQMRQLIDDHIKANGFLLPFHRGLDLGCGTGLVGAAFQDIVDNFEGVDLSVKMLEQAQRKGMYDTIHVGDVQEFLEGLVENEKLDLITAGDLFVYIGDLIPIFTAIRNHLQINGLFVFTIECVDEISYVLRDSGRYAHSRDYIEGLAAKLGFSIQKCVSSMIRMENGIPVDGFVFVMSPNNTTAIF